jgi:hypothetical protein
LYVVGLCTSYLLGHRAGGLRYEQPAEDAVLQVEFGVFAMVGALQVMTTVALVVAIFKAGDTYIASTTRNLYPTHPIGYYSYGCPR